jgi:hypothetical protein
MMRMSSWCCIGVLIWIGSAGPATAQGVLPARLALGAQQAGIPNRTPATPGVLQGVVTDVGGKPLAGVIVSALGADTGFAVSDDEGRFTLRDLSPGEYLLRARLRGYLQTRERVVQVRSSDQRVPTLLLTRSLDVLTASAGGGTAAAAPDEDEEQHGHDELAWRLRHARRSVLKDAGRTLDGLDDDTYGGSLAGLSRAIGAPARLASAFFADLPLSAQIHLLTTTSFARPEDLFSGATDAPHGVAYLSVEAPGASGQWTVRGAITQGELSSWILAGSYVRQEPSAHLYEAGMSYGMQRYLGGNDAALAAIRDGGRNVGVLYAYDDWAVNPHVRVGYGARYARYDYLEQPGLLSPRVSVAVRPNLEDSLRLRGTVSHREIAPGAEEFMPPSMGPWLPPERSFSQISRASFRPERHDYVELAMDREWPGGVLVGLRAFNERVDDQLVTVFGADDSPRALGHYQVGSAGDYEAKGWGLTVRRSVGNHVTATVDYSRARADWRRRSEDAGALAVLAASVLRDSEAIHDLTAAIESVVAPTATRVLVIYKVNGGFTQPQAGAGPSTGVRFDVRVNQALPFMSFTSGEWEMLVAVSNLFREDLAELSTYDELMVVRPPKRVVGGVTVRF